MKRFILFITLLLNISVLKSQDTTFNKLYRPYDRVTSVTNIISVDSYYYALFGELDANNKQNYGILKFNKSGIIIDSSLFNTSDKYRGTDQPLGHGFIFTSDSCFLYCGGIKDTAGWVNGFLAKFDLNMDTIWTKIFYHPDTLESLQKPTTSVMHLSDVKETPDGDYILIGNYNSDADGYEDRSFLLKLDTTGNVINFTRNNFNSLSYDIEVTKDSGYVYLSIFSTDYKINKVDKNCVVQWRFILSNNLMSRTAQDIEVLNDSIIIVGRSYIYQQSNTPNKLEICKFNIDKKTIIWRKDYFLYYNVLNLTLIQSMNIDISNDSNIVISATSDVFPLDSSNVEKRGAILKINQNGDSLWQRYYAHNWEDSSNIDLQLNDLIVCDDGGFLFGGFVKDYSDGKVKSWLVKTDSMGMTQAAFTLGVEDDRILVIKKQSPLFYPNPVYDNLYIQFDQISTNNYELNIYSITGTLVKHQKIGALGIEYRINIQDLKPGIYLVSLVSGGQLVYSQKIIKK